IEADLADAYLPFRDAAAVAASETAHKTPVELLVELPFGNVGVKNILECSHKSRPSEERETGKSKLEIRRAATCDVATTLGLGAQCHELPPLPSSSSIIPLATTPECSTRQDRAGVAFRRKCSGL